MIVFCFWAAFGKYGKIKLGGSDAKPTMSFTSWFFVTLISGIAIGTVYWSVGEPISYLTSPPGFTGWEPYSAEAAEGVLKYNFLHWGIHPYAIYTGFGLCFAFIILNGKRRFSMSSGLYPLIGNKTEGIVGKLVNGLCMFSILGCMGTSLGFGVSQFSTGVSYVFGTTISDAAMAVFFIGIVLILAVGTACTGLQKGITPASHVNMYIFIALMVWAFIFGGPLFYFEQHDLLHRPIPCLFGPPILLSGTRKANGMGCQLVHLLLGMVAGSSSQCGIVPDQISKGTHNPRIRFGQYDRPDYLPHRLVWHLWQLRHSNGTGRLQHRRGHRRMGNSGIIVCLCKKPSSYSCPLRPRIPCHYHFHHYHDQRHDLRLVGYEYKTAIFGRRKSPQRSLQCS